MKGKTCTLRQLALTLVTIILLMFIVLLNSILSSVKMTSLGIYNLLSGNIILHSLISLRLFVNALFCLIGVYVWIIICKLISIRITIRGISIDFIGVVSIIFLAVSVLFAGKIIYKITSDYCMEKEIYKARELLINDRYIIHAGGLLQADNGEVYSYTNSKEALESCYLNGNRISEFDFLFTADGEIVCAHDGVDTWAYGISPKLDGSENLGGWTREFPPTLKEFKSVKFLDKFTTMTLDELAQFIRQHSDFYVVTDIKDDNVRTCTIIKDICPDILDHFFIQIYHKNEYDPIHALGFNKIIYTLYLSSAEELDIDVLQQEAIDHDLVAFTFWDWMADDKNFLDGMKDTNVPLCVHTVNDIESMKNYIDLGISAIYTDVVDKKQQYR